MLMTNNSFYICKDHFHVLFETNEKGYEGQMSGIQLRWPTNFNGPNNWAAAMARQSFFNPHKTPEDEVKHWCRIWSIRLDTKVSYVKPSEPILLISQEDAGKAWNIICGENIGWIVYPDWTSFEKLKKNDEK